MGAPHTPSRTVLFERERTGLTYRVPSLLPVPPGPTLLAFVEQRLSPDDSHAHRLVLRRGTRAGGSVRVSGRAHWGCTPGDRGGGGGGRRVPEIEMSKPGSAVSGAPRGAVPRSLDVLVSGTSSSGQWGALQVLGTAALAEHRSMNPCPVHDTGTGTVFLFFIAVLGHTPEAVQIATGRNAARLCYVASRDAGLSWGSARDLTEEAIGGAVQGRWAGCRSGSLGLATVHMEGRFQLEMSILPTPAPASNNQPALSPGLS